MMLTRDKIISIFCLIDDILKGIDHKDDVRRQISDSEVILTTIVSSVSFYGDHSSAIDFMKQYGLYPTCLIRVGLTGESTMLEDYSTNYSRS